MNLLKATPIVSQPARKAARGERCTLELPCCNRDPDTTVLAHLPDESNGMGRKPDDLSGCFACSDCHDLVDGRARCVESQAQLAAWGDWYFRRAQIRTQRRLLQRGVLALKGYTP